MKQKTTFPFELIVHDDASTDCSAEIIKDYAKKYPGQIVPILQTENQYGKGVHIFSDIMLPRAKGMYLAFCEGDDYWIDARKLQLQVEYLQKNANYEYTAVYHNCIMVNDDGCKSDAPKNLYQELPECDYTLSDFARSKFYPGQLASLLVRKSIFNLSSCTFESYESLRSEGDDSKLLLLSLCCGRVHVLANIMSAHRVSYDNGSYTSRTYLRNMSGAFFVSQVDFQQFVRRHFSRKLNNQYNILHSGCAVIIKYLCKPSSENRMVLNYAVSSVGGLGPFLNLLMINGLAWLSVEGFRRLFKRRTARM